MRKLILILSLIFIVTLSPNVVMSETLKFLDLVERDGLDYQKFSDVPFTGKLTGEVNGSFKDGKMVGLWVMYHGNGRLSFKGKYKDGKEEGPFVTYHYNGGLHYRGTYKDGKQIGPYIEYDKRGQLRYKGTYKNGVKVK